MRGSLELHSWDDVKFVLVAALNEVHLPLQKNVDNFMSSGNVGPGAVEFVHAEKLRVEPRKHGSAECGSVLGAGVDIRFTKNTAE